MYKSVSEDEYVYEHMHICKDERVGKWCNSLLVSFFICNGYLLYYINPTHMA